MLYLGELRTLLFCILQVAMSFAGLEKRTEKRKPEFRVSDYCGHVSKPDRLHKHSKTKVHI